MEIWKDVIGYEGLYQISNLGNVKYYKKKTTKGDGILCKKFSSHYHAVGFYKFGKRKTYLIHRLVAFAFIENTFNKPQVNHINGIKTDNRVENLEWVTASENSKHSYLLGLTKPTNKKIKCSVTNIIYNSLKEASLKTGIKYKTLSNMLIGHRKNKTSLYYV
jgi:hypothetical protein